MKTSENTILITGGGSGIGLALAKQFLQLGNKVIICGRDMEKLKNSKKMFPAVEIIQCDIANEDSVTTLIKEIEQKYPDFNFLINNAAIMRMWNIQKKPAAFTELKQEILINLFGTIQLTQSLIPQLLSQKNSIILNISSALAFVPISAAPIYNATKAALHSYSISIRQQLQNTSVKVVELMPPAVKTEMSDHFEKVIGIENKGPVMKPEKLVQRVINGLENNQHEIRPGIANVLYMLNRISPAFAQKMLQKQSNQILTKL